MMKALQEIYLAGGCFWGLQKNFDQFDGASVALRFVPYAEMEAQGYPFHLTGEQLDVGARIMAVADIFSAITEDRPYRSGMRKEHALDVLKDNVERGEICGWVVKILEEHFDEVNQV